MKPIISIVTPSLNQGKFIERTINSVLTQGVNNLEYYIADGGSSDETIDIIKKYRGWLSYVSEKDNGQAAAVNKGIRATSGDIIGWLNSDDIYYPGSLSAVIEYFAAHPDTDVVYGDAHHIDENDRILEPYYTEDWNYERLKQNCFLCQPAVFFRRRLVEMSGFLDEALHYCMDYEYWLRVGAVTTFARIPTVLAGSRMHENNKTLRARISVHKEINDMFVQKMGFVPDKWIYAYTHAAVESNGLSRATGLQNLKFVLALTGISIVSFFRWQHRIPFQAMKTMAAWLAGSLKNITRKTAKEDIMSMLKSLQCNWDMLAKENAPFAIMTNKDTWDLNDFFDSGDDFVNQLFKYYSSLNIHINYGDALDFGCGIGRLTQPLAKRFNKVFGVDISNEMIIRAIKYNKYLEKVTYIQNTEKLPFPDRSFDYVQAHIVLQHMNYMLTRNYFKEFTRVLRPGGILYFQLPASINNSQGVFHFKNIIQTNYGTASMDMNYIPQEIVWNELKTLGLNCLHVNCNICHDGMKSCMYIACR